MQRWRSWAEIAKPAKLGAAPDCGGLRTSITVMLGWRLLVLGVLGAAPAAAQLFQQFFHHGGDGTFFSPFGQSATGEQEAHAVGDASWYQERIKNGASAACRRQLTAQQSATHTSAGTRSHVCRAQRTAPARSRSRCAARSEIATCVRRAAPAMLSSRCSGSSSGWTGSRVGAYKAIRARPYGGTR